MHTPHPRHGPIVKYLLVHYAHIIHANGNTVGMYICMYSALLHKVHTVSMYSCTYCTVKYVCQAFRQLNLRQTPHSLCMPYVHFYLIVPSTVSIHIQIVYIHQHPSTANHDELTVY